jgi:hypothetical protein
MKYKYDKDKIKNELTIEQIHDLVAELGGEPRPPANGVFISQTICHNHPGDGSHKLYYYDNTKLFQCYTECSERTFDIFELICKVKNLANEPKTYYTKEGTLGIKKWELYDAVEFVAIYFGLANEVHNFYNSNFEQKLSDWAVLERYDNKGKETYKNAELRIYDDKILKYLPQPKIQSWENEGIKKEVMDSRHIAYNPSNASIIIPHYDVKGLLVGIRERTLIKENEKYGKYKPAILNGKMYNHPLGFNLYNLNFSKDNIKNIKKAIVYEGEKSCLQYASYFGEDNDISVACCGSSLISYQIQLLLSLGVEEIVIAFDRQFKEIGDDEWNLWTKKLKEIHKKYSSKILISFIFDKNNRLDYKMSPMDKGKEIFIQLFKERIFL